MSRHEGLQTAPKQNENTVNVKAYGNPDSTEYVQFTRMNTRQQELLEKLNTIMGWCNSRNSDQTLGRSVRRLLDEA